MAMQIKTHYLLIPVAIILIIMSVPPAQDIASDTMQDESADNATEANITHTPADASTSTGLDLLIIWPVALLGGVTLAYAIRKIVDPKYESGKSLLLYPICMLFSITPAAYFLLKAGWGPRVRNWYITIAIVGLLIARFIIPHIERNYT